MAGLQKSIIQLVRHFKVDLVLKNVHTYLDLGVGGIVIHPPPFPSFLKTFQLCKDEK